MELVPSDSSPAFAAVTNSYKIFYRFVTMQPNVGLAQNFNTLKQ